jgi:excisionase family DNA binding protein
MAGMFSGMQQAPGQAAQAGGGAAGAKSVPDIMDVTQAAEYLGLAVEEVVELCSSGELKAKKIGSKYRISKAAIDEFMSS